MLKLGRGYEVILLLFLTCTFRYIRSEVKKISSVVHQVGNVTKDSELTFEYGIKRSQKISEKLQQAKGQLGDVVDPNPSRLLAAGEDEDLDEIPFQVQIAYTNIEGASAVRVLTQTKLVTRDRVKAEKRK